MFCHQKNSFLPKSYFWPTSEVPLEQFFSHFKNRGLYHLLLSLIPAHSLTSLHIPPGPLLVVNTITSSLLTLVIFLLCPPPAHYISGKPQFWGNLSALSGPPQQPAAWSHSKLRSTHYKWLPGHLNCISLINWSFTWVSLSTFPPFCELSTPKPLLFIHLWHYFLLLQWENTLPSMAVCKQLLLLSKTPLSKNPPWFHTNFGYRPLISALLERLFSFFLLPFSPHPSPVHPSTETTLLKANKDFHLVLSIFSSLSLSDSDSQQYLK